MKKKQEKNTNYNIVSQVAAYCSLRISLFATAGILSLLFLYLALNGYRTGTPLYILLTCLLLPSLIHGAAFGQNNKKENRDHTLPLPLFRKKYQYSSTKHICANISYLIVILMFAAWHLSFRGKDVPDFIASMPSVIAILSFFLRIAATVGYRLYFHFFPIKAMH